MTQFGEQSVWRRPSQFLIMRGIVIRSRGHWNEGGPTRAGWAPGGEPPERRAEGLGSTAHVFRGCRSGRHLAAVGLEDGIADRLLRACVPVRGTQQRKAAAFSVDGVLPR